MSGLGKTSFAAFFLAKKKYDYYSAKEVIPAQITLPSDKRKQKIVVIDDLYGIGGSNLQQEWEQCISTMINREDIWLVMLSRSDIPKWLYTLSVQNFFYQIGEAQLLLTRKQTEEYFTLWKQNPEKETMEKIWEMGQGYPLWYYFCSTELMKTTREAEAVINAQKNLCIYSNTHVYDMWDSDVLETIMKLSILGEFDLEMAVYMTGNKNVNQILIKAQELGSFLKVKNGVFTIWNPVCYSLRQRSIQSRELEYVHSLYVHAGDCLKIKGRPMDALKMYEIAGAQQSIAELLIQNARENPSTGCYFEMKHYYMKLPEATISASVS